jgi:hypothetical protein
VDWNTLNSTVGGKLQVAVPLARPCFQLAVDVAGAANATQCAEVMTNYLDHGTFEKVTNAQQDSASLLLRVSARSFCRLHERMLLLFVWILDCPNFPSLSLQTEWETCQETGAQCLLDSSNVSNPDAFDPPQACAQGSIPKYFVSESRAFFVHF